MYWRRSVAQISQTNAMPCDLPDSWDHALNFGISFDQNRSSLNLMFFLLDSTFAVGINRFRLCVVHLAFKKTLFSDKKLIDKF